MPLKLTSSAIVLSTFFCADSKPLLPDIYRQLPVGTTKSRRKIKQKPADMADMATRRSYERSSGKIPLSVILNEVEPESSLARTAGPAAGGHYPSQQARSHGNSPTSSLGDSPLQYHSGSIAQSPTFHRNSYLRDMTSSASSSAAGVEHHHQQQRSRGTSSWSDSSMTDRAPRAPRPSYSEEQKFFIMYARIIRDNTWPEIEDRFDKLFGTRTKGGLTSVYYRIRREWGLMEVLKSGPGSYAADCREVEQRAMNFSREFLSQIGYLPYVQHRRDAGSMT